MVGSTLAVFQSNTRQWQSKISMLLFLQAVFLCLSPQNLFFSLMGPCTPTALPNGSAH